MGPRMVRSYAPSATCRLALRRLDRHRDCDPTARLMPAAIAGLTEVMNLLFAVAAMSFDASRKRSNPRGAARLVSPFAPATARPRPHR